MIKPSTFSIVAYDKETSAFGIAVASKFLAVGSVVPWLSASAGAVATQSYANLSFGVEGLPLLREGMGAEEVFKQIANKDPELQTRQVGIVDRYGKSFSFTGSNCPDWAGGVTGVGYAIQGNLLVSENVVKDMQSAYLNTHGSFSARLFAALKAGDAAGGDRRGRQSAALRIVLLEGGYGGKSDNFLDLRVDNHKDPLQELGKMLDLHELYYGRTDDSVKIEIDASFIKAMSPILLRNKFLSNPSEDDETFINAFESFIGHENFEDRYDRENKTLDKQVYDHILKNY